SSRIPLCFFFFQAEDGIRDRNVTGVQTCALPISPSLRHVSPLNRCISASAARAHWLGVRGPSTALRRRYLSRKRSGVRVPSGLRSEERRVGKECRSRWWRY